MFRIEIETNGAAFADGNAVNELRELLDQVSEALAVGARTSGTLHDVNGASCGSWTYVAPVTHLDNGGVTSSPLCGASGNVSSDLDDVTCPACIERHDELTADDGDETDDDDAPTILYPISKTEARKRYDAGERIGVTVDPYPSGITGEGTTPLGWAAYGFTTFDELHEGSASWSRQSARTVYYFGRRD